jgi:hypothetical protein
MRAIYGDNHDLDLQRRLIAAISPRASLGYLLDIQPETSRARKKDIWSLEELRRHVDLYRQEMAGFPRVRLLDGERSPNLICAEVILEVWRALR